MAEISRFPEIPEGVPGGYPVVSVILGVSVARDDIEAVRKRVVHLVDEMRVKDIVGIDDQITVKDVSEIAFNRAHKRVEGISLSDKLPVLPFIDDSTAFPCDLRGIVGAVVGNDEHGYQLGGVCLLFYAVKEVAYDKRLVSCRDKTGKFMRCSFRIFLFVLSENDHRDVNKLIEITKQEHCPDNEIDRSENIHK